MLIQSSTNLHNYYQQVKSVPSSKSKPVPLEQFIGNLKENLLEKILFCSTSSPGVDSIDSTVCTAYHSSSFKGCRDFQHRNGKEKHLPYSKGYHK
jgi:hypothetical protein